MKKQLDAVMVILNSLLALLGGAGLFIVVGVWQGFLSIGFGETIFLVLLILISWGSIAIGRVQLKIFCDGEDGNDLGNLEKMGRKVADLSARLQEAQKENDGAKEAFADLNHALRCLCNGDTTVKIKEENPAYDSLLCLASGLERLKAFLNDGATRMMADKHQIYPEDNTQLQGIFKEILVHVSIVFEWAWDKIHWYEEMLDAIPFLLHATDMDMNWTFLNKPTEKFLGLKREKVAGMHCSNWNAEICGTDRCSAYSLDHGRPTTFFVQQGIHWRVDTNWLYNQAGEKAGYVEVVQDISNMVEMQNKQTLLVDRIRGVTTSLTGACSHISASARLVASGAMDQTQSVEKLEQNINSIAKRIDASLTDAEKTMDFVHEIHKAANRGSVHMANMIQAVKEVNEACVAITKGIKLIEAMSMQTDLLALNASIEAAKAGTAGKGFEVVAENVRALSLKTNVSVANIRTLVADSMQKAEASAKIAEETAESFVSIAQDVVKSDEMIASIAAYVEEQKQSIDHIRKDVAQVSCVAQQNTASAEESAAAGEALSEQSMVLKDLLDHFSKDVL